MRNRIITLMTLLWCAVMTMATERFVSFSHGDILLNDERVVNVYVEPDAPRGVLIAAKNLCEDIQKVCGTDAQISVDKSKADIVVRVVPNGHWEEFYIDIDDDNDLKGPRVRPKITITGSDRRGAIYGIYEVSRQIGVSPWYWWDDVPVVHHDRIYINKGKYTDGEPKVKYRGIFINDESPSFTGWANKKFGGLNAKMYTHIFELLLRLKANFLWPAMWGNAFNVDDPMNPVMADSMGIIMGTSHHEPMMRAYNEYRRRRDKIGPWNYVTNKDRLNQFFREGIEHVKNFDNVVTIGMRGDGDQAMGKGDDDENINTLKNVIVNQRRIISEVTGKPASEVPQLWVIFTEVQRYYDRGLTVPDDVIKVFCDNNWGYIRRAGPQKEKNADGSWKPMGLYYHIDMNGGPWNNRWINCEPVAKLREQLNLAYRTGLDDLWIINVGDLKPKELPIDFIMNYAWNPEKIGPDGVKSYMHNWVQGIFGKDHVEAIASIVSRYIKYNGMRHPETQDSKIFSVMNYHEADRMIAQWNLLIHDADSVKTLLPQEVQDTYYQLVYYPAVASACVAEIYLYAGKNQTYASQGRIAANACADKVVALYKRDKQLQEYYNNQMSNGKWCGMMQDGHFGYTKWAMPKYDSIPAVQYVTLLPKAALGVVAEGGGKLPTFDNMDHQSYYIDVFNRGKGDLSCKVKANEKWILLNKRVNSSIKFPLNQDEIRLNVSIDWDKLPIGDSEGTVTISAGGENKLVKIQVVKGVLPHSTQPYYGNLTGREFSIPATSFVKNVSSSKARWRELPDLGRSDGDMGIWPVTAASAEGKKAPHLDYLVYIDKSGNTPMLIGVLPTQDINPERGLRLGVAIDDAEPIVLDVRQGMLDTFCEYTPYNLKKSPNLKAVPRADRSVRIISGNGFCRNGLYDAVRWLSTLLPVTQAGLHTLHIYMIDPEVVLERIIVNPDNVHPSYLGAPAIKHFVANNEEN